jgi:hypothetical protein
MRAARFFAAKQQYARNHQQDSASLRKLDLLDPKARSGSISLCLILQTRLNEMGRAELGGRIVAEMPIDLLMEVGALALLSLTIISALGWFALHRRSALSDGDPHSEKPERITAPRLESFN